ncbi:MAG TPA: ethanolamine utilization protein EutH [Candidatus Faecousia intestinigallinarum]|nr:ethanolamine utilization protein EutH [Candidatus Faecousia intestinigallinarum]
MDAHELLVAIMAVFAALGALDRIFGSKLGLGKQFEEGILSMGALAMAMVGTIALSPVLAAVLKPLVVPVFRFLGADPAMFAGTILACDMGGASLAREMSQSREAALLGGILTGSMLGATVVFTIPVALGILTEEDRPYLAQGVLAGVVTIPLGILAGGVTAGFPLGMVLRNLIPIVLIAAAIALGLWKAEKAMIRGFAAFGKGVVAVITAGLAAAIVESLTGLVLIPGMAPIEEGFLTVGAIAIVLAGAFPLVYVLTRLLRKPLYRLGRLLGINEKAAGGLVASLANSIAAFGMVKDMDCRGKVINIAFAVSGAFVFGDHLGFTAGFAPEMLPAMIVGKLVGGVSAVAAAWWMTRKKQP